MLWTLKEKFDARSVEISHGGTTINGIEVFTIKIMTRSEKSWQQAIAFFRKYTKYLYYERGIGDLYVTADISVTRYKEIEEGL